VSGASRAEASTLILEPLPAHTLRRIIRPSRASEDAGEPERALDRAVERLGDPRDPETARREGIALHALLQHLSRIDPAHWDAVSAKALPILLPDGTGHAAVIAKARSLLTRPDLQFLFGEQSRGEVPILAQGMRNGAPVTIAGRIDRLVVEPGAILIVDFKSDAHPPRDEAAVPPAYLTQLALYALCANQMFPGRRVDAAILWTSMESLMKLDPAQLSARVAGFTIG
jgi:ATP-dependent helicase/nuclease subunit A